METRNDVRPRLTTEGKFALCLTAGEICLFVPFIIFGKAELGLGSCTCFAMVAIAAWLNWASRGQRGFSLGMVLSVVIQLPLVLYYPWGRRVYRLAWDHAQQLEVEITEKDGTKTYCLQGSLFFASATQFTRFFTPKEDPSEVYLKFHHARIMDSSALEAIEALADRYRDLGKVLHVRGLSENCDVLLRRKDGNVMLLPIEELETT